ncbi:MAG: DUF4249 domain-containing protein [Tannerellaceae bacterium]|nr:DUF4249 domain-containing protein [Tannerellaceae bacterium]
MMNRKSTTGLLLALFLVWLGGCITEYTPKDLKQVGSLLVVEGTISGPGTRIKLSRSVGLLDNFTGAEYIADAAVWVECSDGSLFYGNHLQKGEYEIPMPELDRQQRYRLHIETYGSEYASEFLAPLQTPEVDSIFWVKKELGAPVKVCVATHDPLEQSHFYRWNYKENWEVRAALIARLSWERVNGELQFVYYDLDTPKHIYACWGKDSSQVLHLGSSEKLSEYRIARKELLEMHPANDRISVLYHVAVEQTILRKEAFDYFANLQKNIEAVGGVFSPMPTELRGNIYNMDDREEYVIGYIEVSTVTKAERYMEPQDNMYEPGKLCTSPEDLEGEHYIYSYVDKGFEIKYYYAYRECFDCRTYPGVTKIKPSWWKNEWPR